MVCHLCVFVIPLRGGGDFFGKGPNPLIPTKVSIAMQRHHQRKGFRLPRFPKRWGITQVQRNSGAQTTRSR